MTSLMQQQTGPRHLWTYIARTSENTSTRCKLPASFLIHDYTALVFLRAACMVTARASKICPDMNSLDQQSFDWQQNKAKGILDAHFC